MSVTDLQIRGDGSCNWTAGWSIGSGTYSIQTRRLLATGVLEPLTVIADQLPTKPARDPLIFSTGTVRMAVDASGNAVVVWDDSRDGNTYWRRFE